MNLPEQPDFGGPRRFMDRPVVRVCDHCARVQDGLIAAEPEQWSDQATYMAGRGFTPDGVWWYHTLCQPCAGAEQQEKYMGAQ